MYILFFLHYECKKYEITNSKDTVSLYWYHLRQQSLAFYNLIKRQQIKNMEYILLQCLMECSNNRFIISTCMLMAKWCTIIPMECWNNDNHNNNNNNHNKNNVESWNTAAAKISTPNCKKKPNKTYCKTSNIGCTLLGNKIVDRWDAVGASPVGAAPTTSSLWT